MFLRLQLHPQHSLLIQLQLWLLSGQRHVHQRPCGVSHGLKSPWSISGCLAGLGSTYHGSGIATEGVYETLSSFACLLVGQNLSSGHGKEAVETLSCRVQTKSLGSGR